MLHLTALAATAWMWVSPETGAWRLPVAGRSIAIVDADEAVVTTPREVMVVHRRDGTVEPPVKVIDDGRMEGVARVGGRLIAFGELNGGPTAWELSLAPLAATPLVLDDPGGGAPSRYSRREHVRVSPDGAHVLVCGGGRWPTVRLTDTLVSVAVATNADCQRAEWRDARHVIVGDDKALQELDVTTGTMTPWTGPFEVAGPGKRVFKADDDGYYVNDAKGLVRQRLRRGAGSADIRWAPTGAYAVLLTFTDFVIVSTAKIGTEREIDVPYTADHYDVDGKSALVVAGNALLQIDLATGAMQVPEGNLSVPVDVVPHDGAVVSIADQLRVWRDGKVVRSAGAGYSIAPGRPTEDLALFDLQGMMWWNPDTDTRTPIAGAPAFATSMYRSGNILGVASVDELFRIDGKGSKRIVELTTSAFDAVDIAHGLVATHGDDATYIIDVARKTAWGVQVSMIAADSCAAALEVQFSPDGKQVAMYSDAGLALFDARTGARQGVLELPGADLNAWSYTPTGDLVVASVNELIVWNRRTKTATTWTPPVSELASHLRLDTAGKELAIAYRDGRVLWATLDGLRAASTSRVAQITPNTTCKAKAQLRYADLVK